MTDHRTDLQILMETDHWLAVHKPAHMTVHNEPGADVVSLLTSNGDVHPAHRLDAGTTGTLLLAKSAEDAKRLQPLFESRDVDKIYVARGWAGKPVGEEAGGIWRWSLTKRAESRKAPRGWAGKRVPCRTKWTLVTAAAGEVEFVCRLETGRKHQIRRHAAVAGWPLIGDYRYGPAPAEGTVEQDMCLHAWMLTFRDPWTEDTCEIVAPLPAWSEATRDHVKALEDIVEDR